MKNKLVTFSQFVNEKRRNPEFNKKENFIEFLQRVIGDDPTNWYISFRNEDNVTFTNPFTKYATPAGYYAYPLYVHSHHKESLYQTLINAWKRLNDPSLEYEESLDLENNLEHFYIYIADIMPYISPDPKVVHLLKTNEESVILTERTPYREIKKYLDKLLSIVKEFDNEIRDSFYKLYTLLFYGYEGFNKEYKNFLEEEDLDEFDDVDEAFDMLFNVLDKNIKMIEDVSEERKNIIYGILEDYEKNPKFKHKNYVGVLFNLVIALSIMKKGKTAPRLSTNLFKKLGIDGFVDTLHSFNYIHSAEEQQAVFFTRKVIDELESKDLKLVLYGSYE